MNVQLKLNTFTMEELFLYKAQVVDARSVGHHDC